MFCHDFPTKEAEGCWWLGAENGRSGEWRFSVGMRAHYPLTVQPKCDASIFLAVTPPWKARCVPTGESSFRGVVSCVFCVFFSLSPHLARTATRRRSRIVNRIRRFRHKISIFDRTLATFQFLLQNNLLSRTPRMRFPPLTPSAMVTACLRDVEVCGRMRIILVC